VLLDHRRLGAAGKLALHSVAEPETRGGCLLLWVTVAAGCRGGVSRIGGLKLSEIPVASSGHGVFLC
jgi:hypothetical protein